MSRAGYTEDYDDVLALGRWRAAVNKAVRGPRGQKLFRDAVAALDAMPDKRLIAGYLKFDGDQPVWSGKEVIVGGDLLTDRKGSELPMGCVCLLGAVGESRGIPIDDLDPEDADTVAGRFDIPVSLAREIVYWNDECGPIDETPEQRWVRMRAWVSNQITKTEDVSV